MTTLQGFGDRHFFVVFLCNIAIRPRVPYHHCARAIFAFRDHAFELRVTERVILHFSSHAFVVWIERRSFWYSPRLQCAPDLQSEIIMHLPSRVVLNDKNRLLHSSFFCAATVTAWLGGPLERTLRELGRE